MPTDILPPDRPSRVTLWLGDSGRVLRQLASEAYDSGVSSPPYYRKREYQEGHEEELGWGSLDRYLSSLVEVYRQHRRVLRPWGSVWLNLGDSFGKGKGSHRDQAGSLLGVPPLVAEQLRRDGWMVRSEVVWEKAAPQPESTRGWRWVGGKLTRGGWRPTVSHEPIYLLAHPSKQYYSDGEDLQDRADGVLDYLRRAKKSNKGDHSGARADLGRSRDDYARLTRNARTVWRLRHDPYQGKHAAVYPVELVRRCLLASTSRAGYCASCGAPWARVVEEERTGYSLEEVVGRWKVRQTRGWAPSCSCGTEARRPGHVLDPFGGSGTTAVEAVRLGLDCTLVDLDPKVAGLVAERLEVEACRPPRPPDPRLVVEQTSKTGRELLARRYAVGYGAGCLLDAFQLPEELPPQFVLRSPITLPDVPGRVLTRKVYLEAAGAAPTILGVYESEPVWVAPPPPEFRVLGRLP